MPATTARFPSRDRALIRLGLASLGATPTDAATDVADAAVDWYHQATTVGTDDGALAFADWVCSWYLEARS